MYSKPGRYSDFNVLFDYSCHIFNTILHGSFKLIGSDSINLTDKRESGVCEPEFERRLTRHNAQGFAGRIRELNPLAGFTESKPCIRKTSFFNSVRIINNSG